MGIDKFIQKFIPEIETGIRTTIQQDIPEPYPGLKEMMNYHFGWVEGTKTSIPQGKRIRPLSVLLCNTMCGGDWQSALPAAISIELIHNFSLIHDDIEDESDLRRGRTTLWKKYGIAQAINTGDSMFSLAQINMLKLADNLNFHNALDAFRKLNETCLILTGGQYLDIEFENENIVSQDRYMTMVHGKTAALLSASMEIGAITAGANQTQQEAMKSFGQYLGLAFQIWDDWLGIWGKEEMTGKSSSSDLVSGKKSLPILYALNKKGEFSDIYQKNGVSEENIERLIHLLEIEGSKKFTEETAKKYTDKAINSLSSIKHENKEAFDAFLELSFSMLDRKM